MTISLFLFLLFAGIHFYRLKDERYKWFINPGILLFLFDLTSWISYSFLFVNSTHGIINSILTFTLTLSITASGFVILFNKSPEEFRSKSFQIALSSITFSLPVFIYFLLISYINIPLEDPISLIIAINLGILLFYISIGFYKWELSWNIWRTGWWLWTIFPFVNFYLVYKSVTGIDILTNALNLFGILDVEGSLILAIIISSFFYLPVLYTKIKTYFTQIIIEFVINCPINNFYIVLGQFLNQ